MHDSFGDFMIDQAVKKDNEMARLRRRVAELEQQVKRLRAELGDELTPELEDELASIAGER